MKQWKCQSEVNKSLKGFRFQNFEFKKKKSHTKPKCTQKHQNLDFPNTSPKFSKSLHETRLSGQDLQACITIKYVERYLKSRNCHYPIFICWGAFDQILIWHCFSIAQSGCCKPPTACGYNFVNPTLWQNPTNMAADADCYLWNNDQSQLCFNCKSCKAGLLGNLRKDWRKANLILIITVVVLIWVYVIACSAFRNAQTEDLFRKYKQGWV